MNALSSSLKTIERPDTPTDYARGLELVAELSQSLAASVNIEKTLHNAVSQIAQLLGVDGVSIFLLDVSGESLICRACAGPVDVLGLSISKHAGVVGRTFSRNEFQWVRDAARDPDFIREFDQRTGFVTRSILSAPLVTANGPIGVIQLVNKTDGSLFDNEDLNLLRVLAAPTSLAIAHAALAAEQIERGRIQRELQLARRMQRSLLPKRRRGNFPILAVNRPAREISGDFYDYFELPDGRIGFTIGDVAGKGLDAALLMVRGASLMRWVGKEGVAPDIWMSRVNEELCGSVSHGMFLCAVAGYFDPQTNFATWCNAGFPPAIMKREESVQLLQALNPPLGILNEIKFETQQLDVNQSSLYFFSDGVTDVLDLNGQRIGLSGVEQLIRHNASLAPEARLRSILALLKQRRFADDTTLLLIEPRVCELDEI